MELIFRTILDKSYEERLKADVEKIRQEIGKPVNVRIQGDEAGKARNIIIQTVDAMGNLVDITFKYDAVAQQFIPTQTKIVSNMDKLHAKALRENADREKQIQLIEKQIRSTERQGIAQDSLLNKIDKFTISNMEHIKAGGLSQDFLNLEQNIKNLDPANENFANQLARQTLAFQELGNRVQEVIKADQTFAQALKDNKSFDMRIAAIKKQTIAQQSLLNQIDKHQRSNQAFVDKGGFSQQYIDLVQDINKLDPAHKNFNVQLAEQKLNFQKLGKEVGLYKQSIQEGSRFTHIFGEQIVEAGKKFLTWYLLGNVIVSTLGKIRDGVQFIKDVDKDLTEVSMITGVTREETRQLALEYANLGHEMAKTVGEISAVNKELIRQGLAMDVARERLESILKLSAAANISTDDSLKIITSSVNAMGESAEKTSDVLLLAGAISASSAEQIGEAFTKTASSARATGMSMENLTGILATLIEVTQESPASLGNSMKTLLSRFNRINEETGELNEELNNVHKAFESVGITFLDLEGQIRPVDELLEELSYKWQGLDKNTQMYLATQIAGVRQQNRLLALMGDYSRALEISNELTDAAGTTNLHYARYLNSVEAASNRTQVAFEQLWIKTINSDVLKYFYNMATAVVTLADKIGGLRIVFTLLILVLMNLRKNVSAFFTNLMLLPSAFAQSIAMGRGFKNTLTDIAIAFDLVKFKGIAMQAALSFGLSIAVTILIEGFLKLAGAMDAARQRNEELLFSYNQTIQQNNAHIKSLEALASEYKRLSTSTSLTSEEQNRLNEIQEEIANISPTVVQGYDEQGNAIIRLKGGVSELINELKEANRLKAFELVTGGEDAFKIMNNDIDKSQRKLELLNGQIERWKGNLESQADIYINSEADLFWEKNNAGLKQYEEALARGAITELQFLEVKSELENKMANLDAQVQKLRGDINAATDAFRPYMRAILDSSDAFGHLNEEQQKFLYDFVTYSDHFGDSWDDASANMRRLIDVVQKADFQKFATDIESFNDKLEDGTISAEEYEEEINKIIVVMAEMFDLDPDFLAEIFNKAIPEAESAAEAIESVEDALKRLNGEFNDAQSSFDTFTKALDELDKYGKLSAKTMMDIANHHSDLIIPMLLGEADLRTALNNQMISQEEQALEIFKKVIITKLEDSETFFNQILLGNQTLWSEIARAYSKDGENFKTVGEAKLAINQAVINIVGEGWAKMYGTTAQGVGQMISAIESEIQSLSGYTDNWARSSVAALHIQLGELRNIHAALNSMSSAMDNVVGKIDLGTVSLGKLEDVAKSTGKAAKAAGKALKDPYEEWKRTAEKVANDIIKTLKDFYNKQKKMALAAIDVERKAAEKLHKERIRQLDEQYKAYEELIKLRLREIDDEADEEDFLRDLTKLQEEQADIERNIAKLALDDSFEAKAKREALEEDLANKIEQINELKRSRDKTLRKQALQDQLEGMKTEIDAKKDQEDTIYEAEKARLEKIREETEYHYNELLNNERKFQKIRQSIMEGNFKETKKLLNGIAVEFGSINKKMAKDMGVSFQNVLNIMDSAKAAIKELDKLGSPPPKSKGGGAGDAGGGGADIGGGGGGFGGIAQKSAMAAKQIEADWKRVAEQVGMQFGLTESALDAFINSFVSNMEDGMEVSDAFDKAWEAASVNVMENFTLTEDDAERFAFYYEKYLMDVSAEASEKFGSATKAALHQVIEDLDLTEEQAEIFSETFMESMENGKGAGESFKDAISAVNSDLEKNLKDTGVTVKEFGDIFARNMETSETASEALERTWEAVAREMAKDSGMSKKEIDVFAKSFAQNMMENNNATESFEKAYGDVSKELQKDSKNNRSTVKSMVDNIKKQMERKIPILKTKVENTITTIYENIEKFFKSKHTGGIVETAHSGKIIGNINHSDSKRIWDLFNEDLAPNEVLMKLLKNEVVINPNIALPKFQKNMAKALGTVSNTKSTVINNTPVFNIKTDASATDAKKLAKMTLREMDNGMKRMAKR